MLVNLPSALEVLILLVLIKFLSIYTQLSYVWGSSHPITIIPGLRN